MMKRPLFTIISSFTAALTLSSGFALATDEPQIQEEAQTQEQIYGSQLMTRQERAEHHARMRAAKTAEEREQIRKEHHERMQERAKARGMTLPDEPPARGGGMGPGGMGSGGRNR